MLHWSTDIVAALFYSGSYAFEDIQQLLLLRITAVLLLGIITLSLARRWGA